MYECQPQCIYCKSFNEPHVKRFNKFINKTPGGCWVWCSYIDPNGYGKFSYLGRAMYAHRFSLSLYEPLDNSKEIDHLCRNTSCVNPEHLEQVDHRENVLRSPSAAPSVNALKDTCVNGHGFDKVVGYKRLCSICEKQTFSSPNKKEYMRKYHTRYRHNNRDEYNKYMREYMRKKRTILTKPK